MVLVRKGHQEGSSQSCWGGGSITTSHHIAPCIGNCIVLVLVTFVLKREEAGVKIHPFPSLTYP